VEGDPSPEVHHNETAAKMYLISKRRKRLANIVSAVLPTSYEP